MKRTIRLSKRAAKRLDSLLEYLEDEWSVDVKNHFIENLDHILDHITENPTLFPHSSIKNDVHRCVISKMTTLYYTFDDSMIYVITLFDTRQNPARLDAELG